MGQAIRQILPVAVAVAVSLVPIIGVVLMLSTPRARTNGPAFLLGWTAGLAILGTVGEKGVVRLAVGEPRERLNVFGRERGWVSVWEVINGQPRDPRAVFIETDQFEKTGERIATIRGKGGNRRAGFAPNEKHVLPEMYHNMRVEIQRDRLNGPYAKNRLGVVATDQDIEVMLDHALAHARLGA